MMALYQSKPSVIEAVQWTGDNWPEVLLFGEQSDGSHNKTRFANTDDLRLLAGTDGVQGWVPVPVGHWLVNQPGDKSDIWPVDPGYFAAKYEPAEGGS